ncbi:MAG: hypothetical protein RIE73_04745 [Coleofasciculus sp. C1-SOL-03]
MKRFIDSQATFIGAGLVTSGSTKKDSCKTRPYSLEPDQAGIE